MSEIPAELKYTKEHEWVRIQEDGTALVGITDYAQASLGDVTYVELPTVGASFSAGDTFGVVESVKAASDLFMPVSGTIEAVNDALEGAPELVNRAPYAEAWIARVRLENPSELDSLLDATAYGAMTD
jgi:glycine cleavage system H protein